MKELGAGTGVRRGGVPSWHGPVMWQPLLGRGGSEVDGGEVAGGEVAGGGLAVTEGAETWAGGAVIPTAPGLLDP